nr:MAG TPA: hypothetical protein [Caudoviricetes sp.]
MLTSTKWSSATCKFSLHVGLTKNLTSSNQF